MTYLFAVYRKCKRFNYRYFNEDMKNCPYKTKAIFGGNFFNVGTAVPVLVQSRLRSFLIQFNLSAPFILSGSGFTALKNSS